MCYNYCGYCLVSIAALREFGQNPVDNKDEEEEYKGDRVDDVGVGHTIECIVYAACQDDKEEQKKEETGLQHIADTTNNILLTINLKNNS